MLVYNLYFHFVIALTYIDWYTNVFTSDADSKVADKANASPSLNLGQNLEGHEILNFSNSTFLKFLSLA